MSNGARIRAGVPLRVRFGQGSGGSATILKGSAMIVKYAPA